MAHPAHSLSGRNAGHEHLNPITIGQTVEEMVRNDQGAEAEAVRAYNQAIALVRHCRDQATGDPSLRLLKMEAGHAD